MRIKIMLKIVDIINKWVKDKNENGYCINHLQAEISKSYASRFNTGIRRKARKDLNSIKQVK